VLLYKLYVYLSKLKNYNQKICIKKPTITITLTTTKSSRYYIYFFIRVTMTLFEIAYTKHIKT